LKSLLTAQLRKIRGKNWRKQDWWFGGLVVWWFDVMNKINVHVYEDWTKFQNIL
jgi:hypothetical protein